MDKVVEQELARQPRQGVSVLLPVELGERLIICTGGAHGGQIAAVEADKQRAVLRHGKIGERLHLGVIKAERLVDKGGNARLQALAGQREVHRGGGVDHHGVGATCQQRIHIGEALGDPVLARELVQHLWASGAEQRGDPLVAGNQRQIGLLGNIAKANQGNAHLDSFSLDNGITG